MPRIHDWVSGFSQHHDWIVIMGISCTFDTGPFDDADDAMLRDRMAILHQLGLPRTFQIACAEQKPCEKPGDLCIWASMGPQYAQCRRDADGILNIFTPSGMNQEHYRWELPGKNMAVWIGPPC
ncbi:hypothetical protein ACCO45_003761 [Purpureocillium lilacinum]|uniref:Uncharacterized protein n=1 Tax=Purpureocillium lilacinum TaxID=33203 RepID=A0ACC4E1Y0_PURLI